MTEHAILYRQVSTSPGDDMDDSWVQGYCSCGWETAAMDTADEVDAEIGQHLYLENEQG